MLSSDSSASAKGPWVFRKPFCVSDCNNLILKGFKEAWQQEKGSTQSNMLGVKPVERTAFNFGIKVF